MKTKTELMYEGMPIWRLFFVIALPGMISMFAMSIYAIIEGIFIGQTLGESAFAAINIAFPLVMINFSLADLIGVGASVPISIALGRGDKEKANNVFSASTLMIFITSVIMGSIMWFAATPLVRFMGADGALLDTSVKYLRTFALTGPVTTIFFAMDNYLRISGYVKTSMLINVASNFATAGLLFLFLFVFQMDVVGSALASSISMCLCSAVAILPFLRGKALLRFVKPKFSFDMIKQIVSCGSPIFLSNVAGRVTSIMMNISLMTLGVKVLGEGGGTTAIAIYAVLMYASDLCWPLLYGISDSLAPAIGYNWGAENYSRVKKIAGTSYISTAIVGLISTSILFFFPTTIASLFVKAGESALLSMASEAVRIFCFAYLFRWIAVATQSFFSAIEKPVLATTMSVGVALVFPVILLGALWHYELDGIWFNFVGTNFLAAVLGLILLIFVLKEIRKRENRATQQEQQAPTEEQPHEAEGI